MDDFLYGINTVFEALSGTGRKPLELFLSRDVRSPRIDELQALAKQQVVPIRARERRDLDRLAGHGHHQGVLLRIEPFAYTDLDDLLQIWRASNRPAFFLLLDSITDPHNFGAILRSAEVAGCQGVIVASDRACPVTPVVEKTAAGALAHLPLCQVVNLSRTLEQLKEAGIWCYGLAGDEGSQPLFTTDLSGNIALVVGSEGEGMRPNIRKHCDGLLAIPMHGNLSSLNASVAAGIALFEVVRQGAAVFSQEQ
jgi:23S rRNA (guanosine2251-2'-O)-methyltransferase